MPMDGLAGFNSSLWPVKSVTSLIEGPKFNYCSGVLIAQMVDHHCCMNIIDAGSWLVQGPRTGQAYNNFNNAYT